MHIQLITRRLALSAVAGALTAALLLSANGAQAAPNRAAREALLSALAQAAAARVAPSAARALPAPTGEGRPFRQTVIGDCSFESPSPDHIAGPFCRFPGIAVATNRLLKIENVSCLMVPPLGLLLLATSGKVSRLFSSVIGAGLLEGFFTLGGPFYVPPGEKVFIWGRSDPGGSATCTVHGLLLPID